MRAPSSNLASCLQSGAHNSPIDSVIASRLLGSMKFPRVERALKQSASIYEGKRRRGEREGRTGVGFQQRLREISTLKLPDSSPKMSLRREHLPTLSFIAFSIVDPVVQVQ